MTNAIEGEPSDMQRVRGGSERFVSQRPRGAIATLAAIVQSGTRMLCDVLDQIVSRIRGIAPLALSLGCQSTTDIAHETPPAAIAIQAPAASETPRAEAGPRQLGQFSITFYYVVGEDELPQAKPVLVAANDNRGSDAGATDTKLTSITSASDRVTLYAGGGRCEPIAD